MRSMTPALALSLLFAAAPDQPLPPREAPLRMTLPKGFEATLFAGEPDLVQPIAFCFDARGRLWVAECLSYPNWTKDKEGKDRIVIFEDTDGDGRFDKRTVFSDKIANISGLQVGFGGVWVCATPNLLFIPDRDGDDKPDGPPEVVLDGWDLSAKHNVFNGLTWGPDGWLYGLNGIIATSKIGKPGTPEAERTPINCGVWRYHPLKKTFEVVAWGTTNPWGLDFDDHGEMFITNCVIAHLWHVVPGAHFERMYGQDLNPNCYGLLKSCADHIHWAGGSWQSSRGGQGGHSVAGGGHAHVGCMVYLGDNWPDRYRDGVFMCNLHGSRVNHDLLERQGSGYVAHHGKDFLLANDPWFRGLGVQYGPDGGVFVSDWCDTGECHNYVEVDRTNGRIYKVTYGKTTPFKGDLAKLSDAELVKLQLHKNDWFVRQARRILQERAAAGKLAAETHAGLGKILDEHADPSRRLRALWALYVTGGADEKRLLALMEAPDEYVRAWSIRLALEERKPSAALAEKLAERAAKDPSPLVRLHLASGLQRLPPAQRWPVAEALLRHGEDAQDAYIPLMIWYGVEALVPADRDRSLKLLAASQIPLVREYLVRRVVSLAEAQSSDQAPPGLVAVVGLLADKDDPLLDRDVLRGVQEALTGRRTVPMPKGWAAVAARLAESPAPEVRERALALAVQFGDARALLALRKVAEDAQATDEARRAALQTLLSRQAPDLAALLQGLLTDPVLRGPALRGLAAFDDRATPKLILSHYGSFTAEERADAVATLSSRPAFALALLDAVERKQVPRQDLSAFTVRQLMGLNSKAVAEKVREVWGAVRPASEQKAALMTRYKKALTQDALKAADRSRGRLLFTKTCAACHRLFDDGGAVGPELTGSQRANLDYLLENLLDPSAVVAKDYQMTKLETKNGRTLTGIVKREDDKTLTLQTQNEVVVLPKAEVESRELSPLSLMPDGLLDKLSNDEVRDLIAYLSGPTQVALPREGKPPPRGSGSP
jgi:putative membrane-bound dehydrogenase-like protein